jgi:hypothetical protein
MVKQPSEILPVDINYATVIGGRTVDSITPTVSVPTGMTKVSEQVSGQVLQIYLSSGVNGVSYRWTVTTDIVIGGKTTRVEDEFDVVVTEV